MQNEKDKDNSQEQSSKEEVENTNEVAGSSPTSLGGKIRNFFGDPFGSIGRKIGELLGKEKKVKTSFARQLWKAIPIPVKIGIVIALFVILIIVIILIGISDNSTEHTISQRSSAVSSLGITEDSDETSQVALELYNNYHSLIGFTTDQLDTLYDSFSNDDDRDNDYMLSVGTKVFGDYIGATLLVSNLTDNEKASIMYSINYSRTLYEHIQRTEKYNFNNIIWKEYTHTTDDVTMSKVAKQELELMIPEGIDDETLYTLLKTTAPYLLTQDIPLGMLTGMVTSNISSASDEISRASKFGYAVTKEAMTKMTVNRYVLQTETHQTTYDDYVVNKYTYSYTVREYSNGYKELVADSKTEEEFVETLENTVTDETIIPDTGVVTEDVYWYVAEALTYDANITNNFEYSKYSQSDIDSLKNYSSNTQVSSTPYNIVVSGSETPVINSTASSKYDEDGKEYSSELHTYTVEVQRKVGQTIVQEKEWKDKLTPKSTDYEFLDYDDAKEYNTQADTTYSNYDTDKILIDEETFTNDNPSGNSLFDKYTEENTSIKLYGMSLIDLLDSNSGIYSNYVANNSNVSTYQGIGRTKLRESYDQVKNFLNSIIVSQGSEETSTTYSFNSSTSGKASEDGTLPFVYGTSLGYQVTDLSIKEESESSSSTSGKNLLREYIRYFEGSGGTATNSEGVECYVAYRDSAGLLTVGYGVNLDAHTTFKAELEALIGQTIDTGTLVPCEYVDEYEWQIIMDYYDKAVSYASGTEMKEYQIYALTSQIYNALSDLAQSIVNDYNNSAYWNEETDDQYETLYETYKDDEGSVTKIVSNEDLSIGMYSNKIAKYTHAKNSKTGEMEELPGLVTRRKSEYRLFSLGYFDVLAKFYKEGGGAGLSGIDPVNSDGSIDMNKVKEMQVWYEENVFANGVTATVHTGSSMTVPSDDLTNVSKLGTNTYSLNACVKEEYQIYFENTADGGAIRTNQYFQCTWWAESLGYAFLYNATNGEIVNDMPKFGTDTLGDGQQVAGKLSSQYSVPTYTIDQLEMGKHYIMSFPTDLGHFTTHVAYVEAVGQNQIVISHCGSGTGWYGVYAIDKTDKYVKGSTYVCMEDLLAHFGY